VRGWEWAVVVALLILAWGLRLCFLAEVPPGWRDDELINIHALSSQLLEGRFPLYYLGASGHEPLYHHLHAGVHAVLGFNVLSGHILSVAFGLLSISLTYTLVRRLFPRQRSIAAVAALTMTASFWSLMYSRTAIRHISLPPLAIGTVYAFCRQIGVGGSTSEGGHDLHRAPGARLWGWVLTGFLLGVTLYTYTASRLLPILLALFVAYLTLVHRNRFQTYWRGVVVVFAVMALVAAPLGIAIARGRTKNAVEGIGADARVAELAGPLRALRAGNPRPLLRNTWETLGMFHATGDPEWLYNISGRPVFNLLGGVLVWAGVALCLYGWRQPRYFLLLSWLGVGLSPAFISTPPASLSHTIFAQPVVYIFPALALAEMRRRRRDWLHSPKTSKIIYSLLLATFVVSHTVRDLRHYFLTWPQHEMVRVLYRADYRETAQYVNAHPQMKDVAVASTLLGPWDRLALDVDTGYGDAADRVRLFDPGRCLVWTAGQQRSAVILTAWPPASSTITRALDLHTTVSESLRMDLRLYAMSALGDLQARPDDRCWLRLETASMGQKSYEFSNGLALTDAYWLDQHNLNPGQEAELITVWVLSGPIDLPPLPIVANPPPPGTYAGPRLAVFAHLLTSDVEAESTHPERPPLAVDDGLWVDPLTLRPGDRFIQIHRFRIPDDPTGEAYEVEIGLYDPMTGNRWAVLDAEGEPSSDRVVVRAQDLVGPKDG
jgi:4-amino-4-deoxy-L-arabinose transferase-like glycosyltransferase